MPPQTCARRVALATQVQEILLLVSELARAQLDAFRSGDDEAMMRFDREMELAMGKKERAIGSLRSHEEEHGCG